MEHGSSCCLERLAAEILRAPLGAVTGVIIHKQSGFK